MVTVKLLLGKNKQELLFVVNQLEVVKLASLKKKYQNRVTKKKLR